MPADDDLHEVGSLLRGVMRRLGLADPDSIRRVEEGWDEALGVAAPHARLVRLGDGSAVVEVDHAAWATRVQMCRSRLEALTGSALRLEVKVRR